MPTVDVTVSMPTTTGEHGRCQVCGGEADGVYFGALVCLPCKSFFIRCTKDGEPVDLKCQGVRSVCSPSDGGRIKCQSCRYAKCLKVGMARRSEKPEVIMPPVGKSPCSVCGDIANGLHFGVMTCEGCKKFFRRSLSEASTYTCKGNEDCPVNPRTRNECRRCRYIKCLQMGMSREAIKVGRPPVAKKDARHHPYSDAAIGRNSVLSELSHLQAEVSSNDFHQQPQVSAPPQQPLQDADVTSDFNYLLQYFNSSQGDLGSELDLVLAELNESYSSNQLFSEMAPVGNDAENIKPSRPPLSWPPSLKQHSNLLSDVWLQYLLGDDDQPGGDPGKQGSAEFSTLLQNNDPMATHVEQPVRRQLQEPMASDAAMTASATSVLPLSFIEDAEWIDDIGTKIQLLNKSSSSTGQPEKSEKKKASLDMEKASSEHSNRHKEKESGRRPSCDSESDLSTASHQCALQALKQAWIKSSHVLQAGGRSCQSAAAADTWLLLNEFAIRSTTAWLLFFQSLPGAKKLSDSDKRVLICQAAFGNTILASSRCRQMEGDSSLFWTFYNSKMGPTCHGSGEQSSWQAFQRRLDKCVTMVQQAKLDESECIVLCTLMFMTAGLTLVKDKAFIERERLALKELLKAYVQGKVGTSASARRLEELMQLLAPLQHLTLWHRHLMRGKSPATDLLLGDGNPILRVPLSTLSLRGQGSSTQQKATTIRINEPEIKDESRQDSRAPRVGRQGSTSLHGAVAIATHQSPVKPSPHNMLHDSPKTQAKISGSTRKADKSEDKLT